MESTLVSGCVWAHKELNSEFSKEWDNLGAISEMLEACHVRKTCFMESKDVNLRKFYTHAIHSLLLNISLGFGEDWEPLRDVVGWIQGFLQDVPTEGKIRKRFAGWISSIASLAILNFHSISSMGKREKIIITQNNVSIKSTIVPHLTSKPWDKDSVKNFQLAFPMLTNGCTKNDPGFERSLLSILCFLREWNDGPAKMGEDFCWSESEESASSSDKSSWRRAEVDYWLNQGGQRFHLFWDTVLESITSEDIIGIMCTQVPDEYRGIATIGLGLVNWSYATMDPYDTLSTGYVLGDALATMLQAWSMDFDMDHLVDGNALSFWCPKSREKISQVVLDRHRAWKDTDISWRTMSAVNLYFISGVRHLATVRRTLARRIANTNKVDDLYNNHSELKSMTREVQSNLVSRSSFESILNQIGLKIEVPESFDLSTDLPLPCKDCYSMELMTELFALTIGIPFICALQGEEGLKAAALSDILGLETFPQIKSYIWGACSCGGKVLGAVLMDGFLKCGLASPSQCLEVNKALKESWSPSFGNWVKEQAEADGYQVSEVTAKLYSIIYTDNLQECPFHTQKP